MEVENPDSAANLSKWTDDQELTLLKAVMRYKPVGMHKHFRMLAIREFMLNSGTVNSDVDTHTSIPGIWAKLKSLYDLEKLNDREDSVAADSVNDKGKFIEYWREFELPGEEFEAKMWERRLAPDGSQSPDAETRERRESTVMDSEDPRSSPVDAGSTRGSISKGTRSGRRAAGRLAEIKDDAKHEGRSSRRTSKAATPAEDEDHEMQDADQEEEEEGSGDEEEEESEQEQTEDDRTGSSRGRGRGGRRGRPRRGRRRG